jgi:hypothetical protein
MGTRETRNREPEYAAAAAALYCVHGVLPLSFFFHLAGSRRSTALAFPAFLRAK